jgi:hypothetical protein
MENTQFLNTFVSHSQTLVVLVACCAAFLVVFSILFNRWMDDLAEKKRGYTALLVALGVLVNLSVVAVASWKAAALALVAFSVSGIAMIWGDIRRADHHHQAQAEAKKPRRKALPYSASGLITEAQMALADAQRNIRFVLSTNDASKVGLAGMDVDKAVLKLTEASKVEGE